MSTSTKPKKFVQLNRVYVSNKEIKTQPIVISIEQIESFRPRNTIGDRNSNGNRCTIVTTSGKYINVAEKFSEVQRMLE